MKGLLAMLKHNEETLLRGEALTRKNDTVNAQLRSDSSDIDCGV